MVNYLTFTSDGTTSTIYLARFGGTPNCEYSEDGGVNWNTMPSSSPGVSIISGQSILIRGINPDGFSTSSSNFSTFRMTGLISASGNIMSLIDGVGETLDIPSDYCFYQLFKDCNVLTSSPSLPSTNLSTGCYYYMFSGCSRLITPPSLPATTLADNCYSGMFKDCSNLITVPSLPATTLANNCYSSMFQNCISITTPPKLLATTLATGCYGNMFYGCNNLSFPPYLPATTLANSCYGYMFRNCASIKIKNTPTSGYTKFLTCPSSIPSGAVTSMFAGTGGTYTSNPVANGTYYFEGSYPAENNIPVNVNGTWKDSTPYANVNGAWKEVTPYVNVNGTWKESS